MSRLKAALSFLTILPVGKTASFEPKLMMPWFPVVGLVIGVLLALFDAVVTHIWPAPIGAVLDVIFLAVVTGALHLDGLGDSADGLFSHRSKERTMEIMRDSRLGTMGLVAIVCALGAKGAGLMAIEHHRFIVLLIVPAYARTSVLFGIRYLPYGRPEGGVGTDFFQSPLPFSSFGWLVVPAAISIYLGLWCLVLNAVFLGVAMAMILFYKQRLNCITGDMLGAMVEVTEATLFLSMAAMGHF